MYERRLNLEFKDGRLRLVRTGVDENVITVKNNVLQLTDDELECLGYMIYDLLAKPPVGGTCSCKTFKK